MANVRYGRWNLNDVKFTPKLGGVTSGCLQHLEFNVTINHFSRIIIFAQFSKLAFPICLIILSMPIAIVFFLSFLTWRSHNHFIRVRYTIGGPIGRNVVCLGSPSCYLPNSNSPPYLCFPFVSGWYTYNRSHIRCGSCFFIIISRILSIGAFSVANEMCSLVSTRVGPLWITSS
jgi:hypothetical protein